MIGDEIEGYWTAFAEDRNRWMEQLDKEVKNPPRPKIVEETGGRPGGAGCGTAGKE